MSISFTFYLSFRVHTVSGLIIFPLYWTGHTGGGGQAAVGIIGSHRRGVGRSPKIRVFILLFWSDVAWFGRA